MTCLLVTGAAGQLGRELQRYSWPEGTILVALTSSELDISNPIEVRDAFQNYQPNVVINAAAYTAVDDAEENESLANAVNNTAVANLVSAANSIGSMLVHVSTDYVFDGRKKGWYDESDPVSPVSSYGRSKALGELAAAEAEKYVTLRTSWVYSALGSNFVRSMLRLAAEKSEIGVVGDQMGCPTSAADIASAIADIVEITEGGRGWTPNRLFHLASPEAASWFDFALEIFEVTSVGFEGMCKQLTTSEYPTKALRPQNSRLSSDQIKSELQISLPSWRSSLPTVVAELEGIHA